MQFHTCNLYATLPWVSSDTWGFFDEIREDLHFEMAPCEPEEFLRAYVEKDPDFEELLNSEFSIEL